MAAYAEATGDGLAFYQGDSPIAPPVFAIVPAWPAVAAVLADKSLGVEAGRTVHGEQRMKLHRPIRAGDVLRSVGRLASVEDRGSNEVFVIQLETRDTTEALAAEQEVVVVSRGTGSGEARERPSGTPPPDVQTPPPALERTVVLDPGIATTYARASGDDNSIHLDDAFAKSMGLPGVIVQGLCLLSIALQPVVEEIAGDPALIREVSVRFARPIQPGQAFTTRLWRDGAAVDFESLDPEGSTVLRRGRVLLADD